MAGLQSSSEQPFADRVEDLALRLYHNAGRRHFNVSLVDSIQVVTTWRDDLRIPDGDAPVLWQVAVCGPCLADMVMTRFATVKHQGKVALAKDISAAADAIVKLRDQARRNMRDPAELRAE